MALQIMTHVVVLNKKICQRLTNNDIINHDKRRYHATRHYKS